MKNKGKKGKGKMEEICPRRKRKKKQEKRVVDKENKWKVEKIEKGIEKGAKKWKRREGMEGKD